MHFQKTEVDFVDMDEKCINCGHTITNFALEYNDLCYDCEGLVTLVADGIIHDSMDEIT